MTYRALKGFEQDYLPPVLWSIVVDYAVTLLDEHQYRTLNLLEINGIDIIEHALSLRLCSYCTTNDPLGDDQTRKNHLKHAIAEFRYATFRQYRFRRLEPLAKAEYTRMLRVMRMEPYINDLGLLPFNLETQIFLLLLWTLGFWYLNGWLIVGIMPMSLQCLRILICKVWVPRYIRTQWRKSTLIYSKVNNPQFLFDKLNVYMSQIPKRVVTLI